MLKMLGISWQALDAQSDPLDQGLGQSVLQVPPARVSQQKPAMSVHFIPAQK